MKKKLFNFFLYLAVIIAAVYFYNDYNNKKEQELNLAFFSSEDYVSEESKNIKWSVIDKNNNNKGRFQKGFNSEGQLVFREVRRNDSPPMQALYFVGLGENDDDERFVVQPVRITDCKPESTSEFQFGQYRYELICGKKGKYLHTYVQYPDTFATRINANGFEYSINQYNFNMNELFQNRTLLKLNK